MGLAWLWSVLYFFESTNTPRSLDQKWRHKVCNCHVKKMCWYSVPSCTTIKKHCASCLPIAFSFVSVKALKQACCMLSIALSSLLQSLLGMKPTMSCSSKSGRINAPSKLYAVFCFFGRNRCFSKQWAAFLSCCPESMKSFFIAWVDPCQVQEFSRVVLSHCLSMCP